MLILEHMSDNENSKKDYDIEDDNLKNSKDDDKDSKEDDDFEPKNENKIDHKESFLGLFKSLKPDEINSLNTDTQELIKTQKQLIETLQSMGPALKEGKTILDTFKNYFNDGGIEKLSL